MTIGSIHFMYRQYLVLRINLLLFFIVDIYVIMSSCIYPKPIEFVDK